MFGKKPGVNGKSPSAPPGPGVALRDGVLTFDPVRIGLPASEFDPVWGVVMDSVFADGGGWHCLAGLSDGTTSLYSSGSFGIIGGGAHDKVRTATQQLLSLTQRHLDLLAPSQNVDLPSPGRVTIRARTFEGQRTVTAAEQDLGHNRHPASALFHAAHTVVGELRKITER
jgi:hypothetical protein